MTQPFSWKLTLITAGDWKSFLINIVLRQDNLSILISLVFIFLRTLVPYLRRKLVISSRSLSLTFLVTISVFPSFGGAPRRTLSTLWWIKLKRKFWVGSKIFSQMPAERYSLNLFAMPFQFIPCPTFFLPKLFLKSLTPLSIISGCKALIHTRKSIGFPMTN